MSRVFQQIKAAMGEVCFRAADVIRRAPQLNQNTVKTFLAKHEEESIQQCIKYFKREARGYYRIKKEFL
jgi:hypothetical protein